MSVNIQHEFEYMLGDLGSLPSTRIVRDGKAPTRDATIYHPTMDTYAKVQISASDDTPTIRMSAAAMRDLATYLNAAADWMDAGLRPGVEYRVPTLLTERDGDTYYTGPLDFGKWYAEHQEGRYVDTTTNSDGAMVVNLCDDEDKQDIAEWGVGNTEEEAWRFALGAMFGPIDGYDEEWLLASIAEYDAERSPLVQPIV